jgi:hypothetical protein
MDRSLKRDKQLILMSVLEGKLGAEHLTMKELKKLEWQVIDAVYWKKVEELEEQGRYVFDEYQTEWLQ